MKRKRKPISLPDAINCSVIKEFTQIPNELIRNPNISGKAKAILCLLLSNREGWKTHVETIVKMMKESKAAIASGLAELEDFNYLIRLKYRDKNTKAIKGTLWAYTDIPGIYNIQAQESVLLQNNMEIFGNNKIEPQPDLPALGEPALGNQLLIILTNKKRNKKEEEEPTLGITSGQFKEFWKVYPNHTDEGKSRTRWDEVCRRRGKRRPTIGQLKRAIAKQKESERWQNKKYIPLAATWLNQSRWLDDPGLMVNYDYNSNSIEKPNDITMEQVPEFIQSKIQTKSVISRIITLVEKICDETKHQNIRVLTFNICELHMDIVKSRPPDALTKTNHSEDIGSPILLIEDYWDWVQAQTWLKDISENLFKIDSKVFKKFLDYFEDRIGLNPLTGGY